MNYVIYNYCGKLEVGYMKICTCEKCKKRGVAEIFIRSLDDEYIDCIKANDTEDILYIGTSLSEAVEELRAMYDISMLKMEAQLRVQENLLNQLSLIN